MRPASDEALWAARMERTEHLVREVMDRFRIVRIHHRDRVVIENRHPARTAISGGRIADVFGLKNIQEIKTGLVLHDVGKCHEDMQPLMKILKGKKASDEQRMIVRIGHTKFGPIMLDLLEELVGFHGLPYDKELTRELCLYHHPEIDLQRADRRLEVKIVSVADKFDALTSGEDERSHREPFTEEQAIKKMAIWASEGILDAEVTRVFVEECLKKKFPKLD